MKPTLTQSEIMQSHSFLGEPATPPPQYGNKERRLVVSFIIGTLIFWGAFFYVFMA
jgi:hypothetical protein